MAGWYLWVHFNLLALLLLAALSYTIGWIVDAEAYKQKSRVVLINVTPGTYVSREDRLPTHVVINEFRGKVDGQERSFATYFYPSKYLDGVTIEHEQIYAVVNVDDLQTLGTGTDEPIPVLKYGSTPTLENLDFGDGDVNKFPVYDVYAKNVSHYLRFNRAYAGFTLFDVALFLLFAISLPWGIGCLIRSLIRRFHPKRQRADEPEGSRHSS